MSKVLGIDVGLSETGWAVVYSDFRLISYGVIKTKKWENKKTKLVNSDRDRIDYIASEIQVIINDEKPDYIAIEDFVYFGNKGKTTTTMPMLVENVRFLCRINGIIPKIYTNGHWKKTIMDNHKASKIQAQFFIHHHYKLDAAHWNTFDKGGHIRDAMAVATCVFYQIPKKKKIVKNCKKLF